MVMSACIPPDFCTIYKQYIPVLKDILIMFALDIALKVNIISFILLNLAEQ